MYAGVKGTVDPAEGVGDGGRGVLVVLERTIERVTVLCDLNTVLDSPLQIAALGARYRCRRRLTQFYSVVDETEETFLLADNRAGLGLIHFHLSV